MRPVTVCLSLLLVALVQPQYGLASSSNNWFTKSLDYFNYENCSPLEKTDISGKFYKCIDQPKRDRRAAGFGGFDFSKFIPAQATGASASGKGDKSGDKSESQNGGFGQTGGFGSGMIPDFASKYQQGAGKKPETSSSDKSEWSEYSESNEKYPNGVCK